MAKVKFLVGCQTAYLLGYFDARNDDFSRFFLWCIKYDTDDETIETLDNVIAISNYIVNHLKTYERRVEMGLEVVLPKVHLGAIDTLYTRLKKALNLMNEHLPMVED